MPTFYYTAKTLEGKQKTGELEAKDENELASLLRGEGYFLVKSTEQIKNGKGKRELSFSIGFFGVPLKEKIIFVRNLSVMLRSGVPIVRALSFLAEQTFNKKFKKIIQGCQTNIEKGGSLSETFSQFPEAFSTLFVSMIKVGEEGGKLDEVLNLLAYQMKKEHNLKSKIKGAMFYPAVILVAMIGIGILMMIVVVPQLSTIFEELEIDLPPTTQFVILLGNFLANFWYLIPLAFLALIFLARSFLQQEAGKRILALLFLRTPFFRGLVQEINSATLARTLSSLIKSGVPIVRALTITSDTLSNYFFKKSVIQASEEVKKGKALYEAFSEHKDIFPPLIIEMMRVGEESGSLSETLEGIADFYEEEVTNITSNLSTIIEPILMIIIGIAVGFFAISMIQPMYSMMGSV